jgi:hypothetical protein
VTDHAFEHIKTLPLAVLSIARTNVTDEGVDAFHETCPYPDVYY